MNVVSFPVSPDVTVNMTNDSLKLNKRNYIRVPAIEKKRFRLQPQKTWGI